MDTKSISSLEDAMRVFKTWKNSSRQMVAVCTGGDNKSTFSTQGYIVQLSTEWIAIAGEKAGHVALFLPGLEFGARSSATADPDDPIETTKRQFPFAESIEIWIPGGGHVLIVASPIDPLNSTSKN
jgi:hypothetical protein